MDPKIDIGPSSEETDENEKSSRRTAALRRRTFLKHLPKRNPVLIEFTRISYKVKLSKFWQNKKYKTLLTDCDGVMLPGSLNAIMGPSGAGKTSLMNILAGYQSQPFCGEILINRKERDPEAFKRISCYIMQEVALLRFLTVREAMMVAANLKLGRDINHREKEMIIEDIVQNLGIHETLNTRTGDLSGGQGKRLSVALELVSNPPVMFLDEPTSGLDSSTCAQLCNLLQTLAREGRTIVCTIHQPSARIIELFDYLYVVGEGACIYRGYVPGVLPYLKLMGFECPEYHNPADYLMEVVCEEHGPAIKKLRHAIKNNVYQQFGPDSSLFSESLTIVSSTSPTALQMRVEKSFQALNRKGKEKAYPRNSFYQFGILSYRTLLILLRDPALTQTRFHVHVLIGILIGCIYWDVGNDATKLMSNGGCLFFTCLFIMFAAMMPTILTIPLELKVFQREYLNSWYNMRSIYFAQTLTDIPSHLLFTSLYVVIMYYMSGQPTESSRVGRFLLSVILLTMVATSLGLLIGTALPLEIAVFVGPILTIPTTLFAGYLVPFGDLPSYLKWCAYTSYIRYGFEGMMIAIYGFDRDPIPCREDFCPIQDGREYLEQYSMNDDSLYARNMYVLASFTIAIRIATFFVLRYRLKK